MGVFRVALLLVLVVCVAGCQHRGANYKNEFELVAASDVVPEPVDHAGTYSIKDNGVAFGLSEAFSSRETQSWRTRVSHRLRGQNDEWDTSYTHSTKDYITAERPPQNPIAIYKRTGKWPLSYTLDTGDRLRVIVYSQKTLSRVYKVDDSGYISVPLVGQVLARGATVNGVRQRITRALASQYLRDPKVSVEVATYRPFFVLDQVQAAGQYSYVVGMTAEMAAAIAGGFTPRANERKFRLNRVYQGRRYTLLVSKNFPIFPGDTLYVEERFF